MLIKAKANKRCLWCKTKIEEGDEVTIYPEGLIVHNGDCKQKILQLAERYKSQCLDSAKKI